MTSRRPTIQQVLDSAVAVDAGVEGLQPRLSLVDAVLADRMARALLATKLAHSLAFEPRAEGLIHHRKIVAGPRDPWPYLVVLWRAPYRSRPADRRARSSAEADALVSYQGLARLLGVRALGEMVLPHRFHVSFGDPDLDKDMLPPLKRDTEAWTQHLRQHASSSRSVAEAQHRAYEASLRSALRSALTPAGPTDLDLIHGPRGPLTNVEDEEE